MYFSRIKIDFIERWEASRCAGLPGTFLTFLPFFFVYIGSRVLYTQLVTMCSLMNRVRPVQRALAVSLRLRTNTEGSTYATAENRRFSSGVSAGTDPLRATRRLYCSRMVFPQGLFFRQVGLNISTLLCVCVCSTHEEQQQSLKHLADIDWSRKQGSERSGVTQRLLAKRLVLW